jgi:hypothetical protein
MIARSDRIAAVDGTGYLFVVEIDLSDRVLSKNSSDDITPLH